jgi:hypothetical protein
MNSRQQVSIKILIIITILLFVSSCGNWGWQDIDSDNQEKLNIVGVISLDNSLRSFIIVHKTLATSGSDSRIISYDTTYFEAWQWYDKDLGIVVYDTLWYNTPHIHAITESRYLVKDATVTVSDDTRDYAFVLAPETAYSYDDYYYGDNIFTDPAIYLNTDGNFVPAPESHYTLSITTPDGLALTASVQTPPLPQIIESDLSDTLSVKRLFEIKWKYDGDYSAMLTTGTKEALLWEDDICGMYQYGILEPGDTTWNSSVESWCYEIDQNPNAVSQMDIRLRFLDEHYYDYFLATNDGAAEISNFLVGNGAIGVSAGVEGGFGVFGALSGYWTKRVVIP